MTDVGHDKEQDLTTDAHTDRAEPHYTRPRRQATKPERYRDFVCCRNYQQEWQRGERSVRRMMSAPRPPVTRKCKYCDVQLEGKRTQQRHVQERHQDVLAQKREAAQTRDRLAEQRNQLLAQIRTCNVRGIRMR